MNEFLKNIWKYTKKVFTLIGDAMYYIDIFLETLFVWVFDLIKNILNLIRISLIKLLGGHTNTDVLDSIKNHSEELNNKISLINTKVTRLLDKFESNNEKKE